MAKRRKQEQELEEIVVNQASSAEDFLEKNQKTILGVILAVAIVVGGYMAYKHLIKEPAEKEAMSAMSRAEFQFSRDSFAVALNNPGNEMEGFLGIMDSYSGTRAANLSKYYAGISYLNLGNFDSAIEYLSDFSPEGKVSPIMKNGALGDAYSEQGDMDSALSYYEKAGFNSENNFLAPYYLKKYGMLCEREGKKAEALKAYQRIKDKFPNSTEGSSIDKFIMRVS